MKSWLKKISGFALVLVPGMVMSQVGNPAPDFTVTDTHGNTHRLYDYVEDGKVVVLDFFYTTCGPCQFYSPQVNLAYEKYGCNTADVIFISIDHNDTNAEVLAYDEEYNIEYPSVSGLDGGGNAVVTQYGILGFPTFYVIDSTKTIIDQIDPPTLQVFDFRFEQHGILPMECSTTSSPDIMSGNQIRIYPNPLHSGSSLHVQFPEPVDGSVYFEIINSLGQLVISGETWLSTGQDFELPTENLTSDLFFLKMNSSEKAKDYCGHFILK